MEHVIANLLRDFEQGKMSRRQLIQSLAIAATATATAAAGVRSASAAPAPDTKGFKAVAVNHISYGVADYARTRDFYADSFGDEGLTGRRQTMLPRLRG